MDVLHYHHNAQSVRRSGRKFVAAAICLCGVRNLPLSCFSSDCQKLSVKAIRVEEINTHPTGFTLNDDIFPVLFSSQVLRMASGAGGITAWTHHSSLPPWWRRANGSWRRAASLPAAPWASWPPATMNSCRTKYRCWVRSYPHTHTNHTVSHTLAAAFIG